MVPGSRSAPTATSPSREVRRSGGNDQRVGGGSTGTRSRYGTRRPATMRPMTAAAAGTGIPVWGDPRAGENPPPLNGEVTADLCVVGLGGSGLAAVCAALEAGATVAGVDAGPVGGGAAGRNGGFLLAGTARFHHDAVD